MGMFRTGQTSGVTDASSPEDAQLLDIDQDYLGLVAKTPEDLPEASTAESSVTKVTDGCFSKAETKETQIDDGSTQEKSLEQKLADGEISDSEYFEQLEVNGGADAAAGATEAQAADTNPAPATPDQGNEEKGFQLSSLSPFDVETNGRTGNKLVKLKVPSAITDLVDDIPYIDKLRAQSLSADQFRQRNCDANPFPECAACKLARTEIDIDAFSIHSLLMQIANGINALLRSGTNIFDCPGMMNAMLQDKLGPLGAIVGPAAAGAMIGLTAVRGLLTSFGRCANSLMRTDIRCEIQQFIGTALRTGGGGNGFLDIANGILCGLGMDAHGIFCSTAIPRLDWPFRSSSSTSPRHIPSPASSAAASATKKEMEENLSKSDSLADDPAGAAERGDTVPPEERDNHKVCEDKYAEPGTTYMRKVVDPDGTVHYEEIEVKPGQSLDELRQIYGDLYVEEDTGLDYQEEQYEPEPRYEEISGNTPVSEDGSYFFKNDDGILVPIPKEVITALQPDATAQKVIDYINSHLEDFGLENPISSISVDPNPPTPVEDDSGTAVFNIISPESLIDETITYSYLHDGKYITLPNDKITKEDILSCTTVDDLLSLISERMSIPKDELEVYSKVYISSVTPKNQVYTGSGVLVLKNGVVVGNPQFPDAATLAECVDASGLVTQTRVLASEMVKLNGLGLSLWDLKMAYIIDHEVHGTTVPDDVIYEKLASSLDGLSDDY